MNTTLRIISLCLLCASALGQPRVVIGTGGLPYSGSTPSAPPSVTCTNIVLTQDDDGSNSALAGYDADFWTGCQWFTNAAEVPLCAVELRLMTVGAGDPSTNSWRYVCRDAAGTLVWQSSAFAGSAAWTSPGAWVTNSCTNLPAGVCRISVEPQGALGLPALYVLADFSGTITNGRAGQLNSSGVDSWSIGTRDLAIRLIGP